MRQSVQHPVSLDTWGCLRGKKACIYPGMEAELTGAEVSYDSVVRSENIITSRGMGTAIAFFTCDYCGADRPKDG